MKLKEHVGWWEAGHNDKEYENFPTDPWEECVQHRTGKCSGAKEDPEANVTEPSGGRETCVSSPTSEQDACLLHEDDNDQSMCSCSSPTDGGGDDLENWAVSPSLQVWFGMEALGAHVCDNLEAIATNVQRLRATFRSYVQVEPPEEVPDNSESITSVDSRKVGREFTVRNVTELVVDAGQQADRGRKTRLNDVDGLVRGVTSAGRIERLLRNKRSFGEMLGLPPRHSLTQFGSDEVKG